MGKRPHRDVQSVEYVRRDACYVRELVKTSHAHAAVLRRRAEELGGSEGSQLRIKRPHLDCRPRMSVNLRATPDSYWQALTWVEFVNRICQGDNVARLGHGGAVRAAHQGIGDDDGERLRVIRERRPVHRARPSVRSPYKHTSSSCALSARRARIRAQSIRTRS